MISRHFRSIYSSFSVIRAATLLLCASLLACGPTRPPEPSKGHIDKVKQILPEIPQTVSQTTLLPVPVKRAPIETYTVVVSGVSAKDLLFSMARDAQLNLDIHDDIVGRRTRCRST